MKKKFLLILVLLGLQTQTQTQAQVSPCDSVGYNIAPALGGTLQLNGTISSGFSGSITIWDWSVCDEFLCYVGIGPSVMFNQFMANDTLKVCLSTIINHMGSTYSCLQCDSLVYDVMIGWTLLNIGNPSAVSELGSTNIYDNKTYDMLGRERIEIPIGVMFIKNGRIYLKTKR